MKRERREAGSRVVRSVRVLPLCLRWSASLALGYSASGHWPCHPLAIKGE